VHFELEPDRVAGKSVGFRKKLAGVAFGKINKLMEHEEK